MLSAGVKKERLLEWKKHVIPKKNPLRSKTHIVLLSYLDCTVSFNFLIRNGLFVSFRAILSREGRIQNSPCGLSVGEISTCRFKNLHQLVSDKYLK